MTEEFLSYQSIDGELIKLEKELENNENKKQANLMSKFVMDATKKTRQLNEEADRLLKELKNLEEVEKKGIGLVEELMKQETSSLLDSKLKEFEQKVSGTNKSLRDLERHFIAQAEKMQSALNEFELTKKKVYLARQKYKENKEKYDESFGQISPKLEELRKELQAKETKLNKDLLEKYRELRKDGVFPIIVPLNDKSCGGCRTNLPSSTLEKIKENGYIRCENCHRIIYVK